MYERMKCMQDKTDFVHDRMQFMHDKADFMHERMKNMNPIDRKISLSKREISGGINKYKLLNKQPACFYVACWLFHS